MTRGRFQSSRGSRGSWGGGRGYGSRGNGGRFSSSFNSFDSRPERYSSRGHDDFRRSYRQDGGYGGGRDSGSHRSPERKRMRTEALNSRHDGGYGGDSYSSSRYESSYPPRRSFSSDRRPPSFSRRDEFRKPGPPLPSSPRGGYRGRISSRGIRGSRLRERQPRRRLVESSYAVRRRIQSVRSSDFTRRMKLTKLRSAAIRRANLKRAERKSKEGSDEEEKPEEDEEETEEKAKKDEEETEKTEGQEEKPSSPKKTPKKDATTAEDKEKDEKKSEGDEEKPRKHFIKLVCIHCNTKSPTFGRYSVHLMSSKHISAMRRVAMKQKSILAQMRMSQRNAQRELEKTTDDLAPRTNFCPLCKLNYKQPKATHQVSEAHKEMKKFLMPYCKICKITFKSPMLLENHLCSIEHIKRKSRLEQMNGDKSDKDESGEDDNLENFMTIDSVGDVDEEEGGEAKKVEKKPPKEQINVGVEQVKKVEVYYCDLCRMYLPRVEDNDLPRVLSKHCRMRVHLQHYVRYKEDKDLAKHAERLQRRENAEKEGKDKKKENGEKTESEAADEEAKPKEEKAEEEEKEKANVTGDDEDQDKMWADVDKDLGDILAEGNKSSDEDDDSHANGERYDRFKLSEKNDEEKLKKEGNEDVKEADAVANSVEKEESK